MTVKPIILDVDTGVDDALAIAYAVRSPEIELLGLTTTFGNITVEEATRNSLVVLEKLGRSDVPVHEGSTRPLVRTKEAYPRHIHGEHGLGSATFSAPAKSKSPLGAVDFIIETVHSRKNEVTLVCVGPLTNLAHVVRRDPEIARLVGRVVIMGGAARRPGNVSEYAEANIFSDPEAADIVFRSGLPITLVGLDVTMQTLLPMSSLPAWREKDAELGGFFADMTEFYIRFYEDAYPGIGGCGLHDPLAIGVVVKPELVETEPMHLAVELAGEQLARTREVPGERPNVDVCVKVDASGFLAHFLGRVI
ncbi:nucleoside hydrolase [Cohnella fermenti]|uniref:Nucleoside hydrolase n=1 Tax=Cohnella fermenti TaxID=2565925 RepID=A0A4S4C9U0_9BACL|nr:nucleoside hydrolase [Cohnella fermenti]THF84171.1 nucleoside hydrolase [Cohnella fermenti]